MKLLSHLNALNHRCLKALLDSVDKGSFEIVSLESSD